MRGGVAPYVTNYLCVCEVAGIIDMQKRKQVHMSLHLCQNVCRPFYFNMFAFVICDKLSSVGLKPAASPAFQLLTMMNKL